MKNHGSLSFRGDEVFTLYEYARNADANISRPFKTRVTDQEGNTASERITHFDGGDYVGLPAGQIEKGLVTRVSGLVSEGEYINLERKAYDAKGNVIGLMDGEGNERRIAYDSSMNLYPVKETIVVDKNTGESLEVSAEYDQTLGKPISAADFNGNLTDFVYDALGRTIAIISPGDTAELPTQSFQYRLADPLRSLYYPSTPEFGSASGVAAPVHSPGTPYSQVVSRNRERSGFSGTLDTRQYFDGLGRKLAVYSEAERGFIVGELTLYNKRGLPSKTYLPFHTYAANFGFPRADNQSYSEVFYDALGRSVKTLFPPDAEGTRYFTTGEYAPLERTERNEKNNPKITRFDGREKTLSVIEKNGDERYTVRFAYDTLGNLISVTDANGNVKKNEYDSLGRKTKSSDPDRGLLFLAYDNAGRMIRRTDNKNQRTLFSYDGAGRILGENFVAYPGDEDPEIEYAYDSPDQSFLSARNLKGQISGITDPSGSRFFSYDERGNPEKSLRRMDVGGGRSEEFAEFAAFDALGRTTVKIWPDGEALNYEYNRRGLLRSIDGFLEEAEYNPAGLVSLYAYANGTRNLRNYDPRQRLIGMKTGIPGATDFQNLSYEYGATGNITRIGDGTRTEGAENAAQSFLYDALDRLVRAEGSYGVINYAYDPTGNMIRKSSPKKGTPGHAEDPDVNLGRMIYGGVAGSENRTEKGDKPGPHAVTHTQSGLIFDYDANGNRISATAGDGASTGNAKYFWNWQDRMKRFEGKDSTADYVYGYDGKRASKTIETAGGETRKTLYASDDYEIRDGTVYKYVFANGQRIASVSKSADSGQGETREILLKKGWNTLSLSLPMVNSPDEISTIGTLPYPIVETKTPNNVNNRKTLKQSCIIFWGK